MNLSDVNTDWLPAKNRVCNNSIAGSEQHNDPGRIETKLINTIQLSLLVSDLRCNYDLPITDVGRVNLSTDQQKSSNICVDSNECVEKKYIGNFFYWGHP